MSTALLAGVVGLLIAIAVVTWVVSRIRDQRRVQREVDERDARQRRFKPPTNVRPADPYQRTEEDR